MDSLFADVALGIPSRGTFQYAVPPAFAEKIKPGCRVWVNVRARRLVGTVTALSPEKVIEDPKPIEGLIDETPVLDAPLLALTRWMAEYYFCSWGQAIEAALPAPFKKGKFLMKSRAKKIANGVESVDPLNHPLTADQENAFREIMEKINKKEAGFFLLHGITGSGKTEIYMQVIGELLKAGRGSIVLVPEISLTPQAVERFHSRFGDGLAVIHSRLSQGHRVEEWHRIKKGEARVVVGARSALFSPVQRLGLIVIDEEHDTSYKQEETPRYQARTVAAERARLERAVLLMGSATPSLETYFASLHKDTRRLFLPERIQKRPLPVVQVVDMRREPAAKGEKIFSRALEEAVKNSLKKKEQVMLFLNRRGFSTHLHCASCGYVMTCPNCRVSLAYHFDKGALYCHACGYRTPPIRLCPGCQKNYLHYFGAGTQKVEEEARRLFPEARLARMDTDSTSRKDAHETILKKFKKREVDLLIGTQMIAKGHDFPNVSLIGVISADTALHIPDFRAAERTFNLLTQVAGRAGRGAIPGKVIVQTHLPSHYAIESAKDHDYEKFYSKEIIFRKELGMPPYSHLIQIVMSGGTEKEVVRQILLFAKFLKERLEKRGVSLMGPAPCVASKLAGRFRWNVYLKGNSIEEMVPLLRESLGEFKRTQVALTVNVDPQ
ncbi:MAG: primosomal protein N' [Candidatus Omnitrophica bacterium]|nr:primosomal protein N' [Candidatus Omnitrophota bacterium]